MLGFLPDGRVEYKTNKEHVNYKRCIDHGDCIACGDEVIDYRIVENIVMTLEEEYGVTIMQIGYDKWNAISSVQKFEAAGYECVEIKQHSSVLHAPTKLLKEKILSKEFVYNSNRLLEICCMEWMMSLYRQQRNERKWHFLTNEKEQSRNRTIKKRMKMIVMIY